MIKLPYFVIGGERRSGSTTLYEILRLHPELAMHPVSDLDYFIGRSLFSLQDGEHTINATWEEQLSLNGYADLFSALDDNRKIGHKDADLLWWWPTHETMSRLIPKTKFIFVLRNPVKRAESQYWNEVRKGRESLSFMDALQREEDEQLTPWQRLHVQYKERGCYLKSIEHFHRFFPKEQTLVVVLENLHANFENEIKRICRFLEIDEEKGAKLSKVHTNKESALKLNPVYAGKWQEVAIKFFDRIITALIRRFAKNKEQKNALKEKWLKFGKVSVREALAIPQNSLVDLSNFYYPWNEALASYLEIDLSIWKKSVHAGKN